MRTIIVGDIHGCIREFEDILIASGHCTNSRLILVGDLINKGPESFQVLKLAKEIKAEVVLGNHEAGFLKYCRLRNGIDEQHPVYEALISEMGEDYEDYLAWIESWPAYIEDKEFIVVHGGLVPGKKLNEMSTKSLTTIRTWDGKGKDLKAKSNPAWFDFYKDSKLVVFGHWASKGLIERENVIGLDSGCVYGRKLSAVILPERKIVQVDAHKAYQKV